MGLACVSICVCVCVCVCVFLELCDTDVSQKSLLYLCPRQLCVCVLESIVFYKGQVCVRVCVYSQVCVFWKRWWVQDKEKCVILNVFKYWKGQETVCA